MESKNESRTLEIELALFFLSLQYYSPFSFHNSLSFIVTFPVLLGCCGNAWQVRQRHPQRVALYLTHPLALTSNGTLRGFQEVHPLID